MKSTFLRVLMTFILIPAMLLMGSCGVRSEGREEDAYEEDERNKEVDKGKEKNSESPDPTQTPEVTSTPDATPTPTASPPDIGGSGQVVIYSMEDLGMTPLEVSDLNGLSLDARISGILTGTIFWEMTDYANGIDLYWDCIIIAPRYTGQIIGPVSIGMDKAQVVQALGTPSYDVDDIVLYRTDDFYLAFLTEGSSVAYAGIFKTPVKNYPDDILKDLLEELNSGNYSNLMESIERVDPNSVLFTDAGFIHGGGDYADSIHGIHVTDFDERIIDIYTNFEGDIYVDESSDITFSQAFNNRDAVEMKLRTSLYGYQRRDELFETQGMLSPDGKLSAVYEWVYSMEQYFIIRTLDFSIQDRYIWVPSSSPFYWLNNHVLLYVDFNDELPMAIDINTSMPSGVNILVEAGVIKDTDVSDVGFTVVKVENGVITVEELDTGTTYDVAYTIDASGNMTFTLQ
jgi:hypothetical protein